MGLLGRILRRPVGWSALANANAQTEIDPVHDVTTRSNIVPACLHFGKGIRDVLTEHKMRQLNMDFRPVGLH